MSKRINNISFNMGEAESKIFDINQKSEMLERKINYTVEKADEAMKLTQTLSV